MSKRVVPLALGFLGALVVGVAGALASSSHASSNVQVCALLPGHDDFGQVRALRRP